MKRCILLIISLISVFFSLCGVFALNPDNNSQKTAEVESEILEEFKTGDEVGVIVLLKDDVMSKTGNKLKILLQEKSIIREQQDKVLFSLILQNESSNFSISEISGINASESRISGFDFKLKYQYETINAFSGKLTKQGLLKLKNNSNVKGIFFDKTMYASLDRSVPFINADDVWAKQVNDRNINGTGETVCVIDTGVDYNHPDLGGGWGNKVIGGYDFVNKDIDPMDDNGHGTNVAGIIASTNKIYKGVAPGAKIIAIKALDSDGHGDDSDVIAGIDWCVNNARRYNISVISMSLGDRTNHSSYCNNDSDARAINNAVSNGILVAVASGNNGSTNSISSPACVQNATAVGASGAILYSELFVSSDGNKKLDSNPLEYSAVALGLYGELLYADLGYSENFTGKNFTGKIALIKRGILLFSEKVQNAYNAGAVGAVIFNKDPGNFNGTLSTVSKIPAVSISLDDGNYLLDLLNNSTVAVNMTAAVAYDESIAPFTNRNMILGLLAPGVDITSTKLKGGFELKSGTSMAVPHVSGAVLLLSQYQKECRQNLTPKQIEVILKNTGTGIYDPLTGLVFPRINILNAFNSISCGECNFSSYNCNLNQFCSTSNLCQDLNCAPPNGAVWNHTCVNCTDNNNCGTGQTCSIVIHQCRDILVPCISNYDCGLNQFCSTSNICRNLNCAIPNGIFWNHTCVNCTSNASCSIGTFCDLTIHKCQNILGYCTTNESCGLNQTCNTTISQCRDLNCSEGYYPQNHECFLNTSYCFNDSGCSYNQTCITSDHSCLNLSCSEGYYPQNHSCVLNVRPGDSNGDGFINIFDVIWAKKIVVGLPGPAVGNADADCNGVVNIFDVIWIEKIAVGLPGKC